MTGAGPWGGGTLSTRERLLALVQDEALGPDAWGDVFLFDAIGLAEALRDEAGAPDAAAALDELTGQPRLRLLQVLASVPDARRFGALLARLSHLGDDEAEVVIDGLRGWSLPDDEREALRAAAQAHRGRSRLLDLVIDAI